MKHMYLVMDSRAQFDIDKSTILECCGNKKPSWRSLGQDWPRLGKPGSGSCTLPSPQN